MNRQLLNIKVNAKSKSKHCFSAIAISALFCLPVFCLTAQAQQPRATPINTASTSATSKPTKSVTLPIEHWQQKNGVQIWLVNSPNLPMLDVNIDFDAGSRRDPQDKAGLAQATASLFGKGIAKRGKLAAMDENQINDAWADLGAIFSASASSDRFTFRLRSLTESDLLNRATALAARQLADPVWSEKLWQPERQRFTAAIKEAHTRPDYVAYENFQKLVFGKHPYGYNVTAKSLGNIQAQDMRNFYQKNIKACRAKVSIVGRINHEQADQLITKLFALMPQQNHCDALPVIPDAPALNKPTELKIPFVAKQASILIGQPGIRRDDPKYFALRVGNHILGGSGLNSLLMKEVREKRGLVYGVSSSFNASLNTGAFVISLETRADQASQAADLVHKIVRDFVAKGPTEKELQEAKDNLTKGFALRLGSNGDLLANVANIAWFNLPLDFLDHWTQNIQAVSLEDVRRSMRQTLNPDAMVTVVVGEKAP